MTYGRNDTEKVVYTYGEERIAEDDLQTDETAEYLYDGRGSVVQTTIYTEVELSITYDPFGAITGGVDENFVGYAYNGEESSEVTGLQYLRARYYDTELGFFLTIDSYLGSLDDALSQNRYTYANNDPVNNIDPSGHYSVNVNGANQYYQSTGLNEIRDYMTASALWAGEVSAQNGYNNAVARANNTSFQNYASISGISQSTADSYINKGIAQAGQVSMNYGCSVPTVPNEAVAEFADNVNDARESANAKIEDIKRSKKEQNDTYEEYLKFLDEIELSGFYIAVCDSDSENSQWTNVNTNAFTGLLATNMFAYSSNNLVSLVDYASPFWKDILELAKEAIAEIVKTMGVFSPVYAGFGGTAVADGPLPFGDMIGFAGAVLLTIGVIAHGIYQVAQAPAVSIPKEEEKTDAIPIPQDSPTIIYRYGGTNPGNLTPKEKDRFSGLSFSTVPRAGAAMTTIEAINATGIVYAVRDGATHVSVKPIGGTMDDWISAGSSSIWTQAVKSVVIKYGG